MDAYGNVLFILQINEFHRAGSNYIQSRKYLEEGGRAKLNPSKRERPHTGVLKPHSEFEIFIDQSNNLTCGKRKCDFTPSTISHLNIGALNHIALGEKQIDLILLRGLPSK